MGHDLGQHVVEHVVEQLAGKAVHPVARIGHHGEAVVAAEVVAVAGIEVDDLAEGALVEQLFELEARAFEVVQIVDADPAIVAARAIEDRLCIERGRRERLFDEHVAAGIEGGAGDGDVRRRRRGDMHDIETLLVEHADDPEIIVVQH